MSSGTPRSTFRLPPRRRPARSAVRLTRTADELRTLSDPWGGGWMRLIASTFSEASLQRGLVQIESGFVARLEIEHGRITASVLRDEPTGRENLHLSIAQIPRDAWHVAASALSPGHGRTLGAERIPADLPEKLRVSGHSPWPEGLDIRCSCRRDGDCEHAAAVAWIIADRLAADPTLALALRGIEPGEFLAAFRQARVVRARGSAMAHPEPPAANLDVAPLKSRVGDFWQCDPCIHELEQLPAPIHAPHALLRRLGPPTFNGKFPLLGLLASVYDTVSESTQRSREHRDQGELYEGGLDS